jgi:ribosomal protein S27AE
VSQALIDIQSELGKLVGPVRHPNDLTPMPLKMTAQERAAVSCPQCGASLMGAVIGRDGESMCGMCGAPIWQDKDGKS